MINLNQEECQLCECGCGLRVRLPKHRFIRGHHKKNKDPWNKGKTGIYSNEVRILMGIKNIGRIPWMKNKKHTDESKQKIREKKLNKKLTKEHKQKISISGLGILKPTWKTSYIKQGIPLYDKFAHRFIPYEEVRRNPIDPHILNVTCAYCGKWYTPTLCNVVNRIRGIKITGDSGRFYCSKQCKVECPIYNQVKYFKGQHGKQGSSREVTPELHQMVFELDNWTCQRCGSAESLHCHHLTGRMINPIEIEDVDNCITFCKDCHKWIHQQPGCTYWDFRRKKCEDL